MPEPEVSDRFYAVLCSSPRNPKKTLARIGPPHAGKGNFWTENVVSLIWKMDRNTAEEVASRLRFNTPQLVRYEKAIAIIERQVPAPEPEVADDCPEP